MPDVILAPATRADAAEAGFDAWFGRTLTGPHVGLVAREAASGRVVGVVNLMEIVANPFYQGAYLGYHGMAALAGRGLMTKAVRLATAHAFEALGLHRLEANIQPGNTRSIALVKRLGFRLEGFSPRYLPLDGAWRDHQRASAAARDRHGSARAHSRSDC